jgi:hypothetical protein
MPGWAAAVSPRLDASCRGDFWCDFRSGEHPAQTRLGALAELDLDRPYRVFSAQVRQPVEVEAPITVTASEVAGADLEHQLAAVQVVRRHAALPGVVQATGQGAAPVDGLDGYPAQGSKAHGGHVDHRRRAEHAGSLPGRAEHLCAADRIVRRVRARQGEHALVDDYVARGGVEVLVGAEPDVVVDAFCRGIDPPPLVPVEGPFLAVVRHYVLAQLGPDRFEQVAQMADYREVTEDGVPTLGQVIGDKHNQDQAYGRPEPHPSRHRATITS